MSIETKIDELLNNAQFEDARIELIKNKMYLDEKFYYANLGYVESYFHHFDEALMLYQKFLEIDDSDPWIYSQLGYILNIQNKPEEALKVLNKAKELGRYDAFVLGEFGFSYEQMNDFLTAVNYYEDALMENDSNPWFYTKAAVCYARLGNYDEAISYLKKAKMLGEHDGMLYFEFAYAYKNKRMWKESYENFLVIEKEFGDEMNSADYFTFSQSCFYGSDETEKALTLLQKAYDMGENHTGVHDLFSDIYEYMGDSEKCLEHTNISLQYCLKGYERDKEDMDILSHLAYLYKKIKDYDKTLSFLSEMKRLGKDDYYLNYQIGHTLSKIEDYEKSNEYLYKALEFEETIDAYSYIGFNYMELFQWEKAKEPLLKCIELGRDDLWIYSSVGKVFAQTGYDNKNMEDHKMALKYLKLAKTIEKEISWIDIKIGWVLNNMGNDKECIEVLSKVVEVFKNDGLVHVNLACSYGNLGEYEKALCHFRLANKYSGFYWDDVCQNIYEKCKKAVKDKKK